MSRKLNHPILLTQITTCLAFMIVLLDTSVVNVAIFSMCSSLHTDIRGIQWVINAYSVVFSSLLLTAGVLGDRYGFKPVFLGGFLLFTFGSLCCGISETLITLIFFRAIQGIGAALLVPTSLSIIRALYDDEVSRDKAVGWWGACGGIALAAGPVVGGILVSHLGWPAIFILNVPLGILGFVIVWLYAPSNTSSSGQKIDFLGQFLAIITLCALTYSLIESSKFGWANLKVITAMGFALVSVIILIFIERSHSNPILPLQLLSRSALGVTSIVGLFANLSFYGMIFVLSLYFQSIRHFSPERTGLAFLPMMAVLVLMNILAGRLLPYIGVRRLVSLGLVIASLGYFLLFLVSKTYFNWEMASAMLLAGGGVALSIPAITSATLTSVPINKVGTASGILNSARQLGGVIGVALFCTLINGGTEANFIHGMDSALIISSMLLLYSAYLSQMKLGE